MNTRKRTTTKRRAAKTNTGETAEQPQPRDGSNEGRAIYALERIAGSFERIALASEAIADCNSSAIALSEVFSEAALSELNLSRPRRAD